MLGDQEEHQPRGQLEHLRAGLGPPASGKMQSSDVMGLSIGLMSHAVQLSYVHTRTAGQKTMTASYST